MSQYLSQTRIEEQIWLEPSDVSFLRKRISEAESQLESLENQISELTRQRDAKLVDIVACKNVLSPIRRVPLEILAEILVLVCRPDDARNAGYDIIRYTSILSRVCVAWRKTAHSTPRLWSNLCISASCYPEVFDGQFVWLKEWIDRCQGRSLDLYLALNTDEPPELSFQSPEPFFHSILRFSHKIRLFNITGCPSSYLPLIDHSSFPLLEEVDFEVLSADDTVGLQKINAFLGAPKLRCARISEAPNDVSLLKALMLPAEQLTSLKISFIHSYDIYVSLLHRCKNLVNLEFAIDYSWDFLLMDNPRNRLNLPILLPSLKSLTLYGNLIECLTAPRLEELTLRYDKHYFRSFSRQVDAFQRRSRTALSTLYFEGFDYEEEKGLAIFTKDLIAMVSLFPTVRKFGIKKGSFNVNPFLRALTVDESRRVLLPKLEHLSLRIDAYADYSSELKALILSRCRWPGDMGGCVSEDSHGSLRLKKVALDKRYFEALDIMPAPPGLVILDSWNY